MDFEQGPGFRFHPTDEELINHYLNLKKLGLDDKVSAIGELDICNFEPGQLPQMAATQTNNYTWYFFSRPDYKYKNSKRANRRTDGGYWKGTGKDRRIMDGNNNEIGTKKTLVFYEGHVPNGVKTNWVIHEFHSNNINQRDFVLSRLKLKPDGSTDDPIYEESQPSQNANQQMEPQVQEDLGYFPTAFHDLDFGYASAQQLEMYMWQEGPSYGSSTYSNGY
ncbi:protein NTM1-like 9 [Tripterygium wilfordii]|uniref:protein NTM1-like 9 n=1 Tax=Tripterygium wilfordii TaxID=458696 RepID=UPI0018F83BD0|nr:protein NTM1-like 9 [Tripterygium wilfordii]